MKSIGLMNFFQKQGALARKANARQPKARPVRQTDEAGAECRTCRVYGMEVGGACYEYHHSAGHDVREVNREGRR